jgi:hypothetical protein
MMVTGGKDFFYFECPLATNLPGQFSLSEGAKVKPYLSGQWNFVRRLVRGFF